MLKKKNIKDYFIRNKSILLAIIALLSILLFEVTDIYSDFVENDSIIHIAIDAILVLVFIVSIAFGLRHFRKRTLVTDVLAVENQQLSKQLAKALEYNKGSSLKVDIETQLLKWQLTKAEIDVALMIIRGLNFYMIADLLNKGERTVRQQAIAVYQKAGFRNRAELTGFFIEMIDEI